MILLAMETSQEYLQNEMKKRGWTQADLARFSKLDPSLINNYLTGRRNIGVSSAVAFSGAFNVPPESVMRAVGLIPSVPEHTERHQQLLYLFDLLDEKDRQTILDMMNFLLSK